MPPIHSLRKVISIPKPVQQVIDCVKTPGAGLRWGGDFPPYTDPNGQTKDGYDPIHFDDDLYRSKYRGKNELGWSLLVAIHGYRFTLGTIGTRWYV